MKQFLFCLLLWPLTTLAQDTHSHSSCETDSIDPIKEAILSEVTVQGITGTQRMKDASSPFMVISPTELHDGMGTNIVDLISHKPGLSQISTGAGISKPVIRGMGYNRVVVMDQGIRQEGQQWGDEHGLEVDGDGIHSVEVLKGPASLMYGSDALAGVMVLHSEPVLSSGTMQVKAGGEYQTNNNLWHYSVGFAANVPAGRNGAWVWNWHYSQKSADDYENSISRREGGNVGNSWFKERSVMGMVGTNRSWGHSWLRFSNVQFKPGIIGEEDAFQKVQHTKVVSDNLWHVGGGTLKAVVGYQNNWRREYEAETDPSAVLAMRLHTINYDVRYSFAPFLSRREGESWSGAVGVGGMWQQNVNGGEERLIPDYRLFDIGAFMTLGWQWDAWHVSGGARYDHRHLSPSLSDVGGGSWNGVTFSVGTVWNVTDRMNLRLNVARGFRAPTASELYADGVHEGTFRYEVGNSKLKSEYSLQTDLGMDYTSHFVNIQSSLFWNHVSNYTFLSRMGSEMLEDLPVYQYRQAGANLLGGEVSVDVHPVAPLHIENGFSYVWGSFTGTQPSSNYPLPLMPAPRWNLNLKYYFPDFAHGHCRKAFLTAGLEYNLRQDRYYAIDNTETATSDYGIVNIGAGIDLHVMGHNCIKLSVTCQNLFGKLYQNHLSRLKYVIDENSGERYTIYAPGRNVCMKVTVPLDIHL